MLATRVVTATVGVPIVAGVVVAGEPWLSILLGIVALVACLELIAMLEAAGFDPPPVLGLLGGLATATAGLAAVNPDAVGGLLADALRLSQPPGLAVVTFAVSVMLIGLVSFTRPDPRNAFLTWAATGFGVAYVGLLLPFLAVVAHLVPADGSPSGSVGLLGLGSGTAWGLLMLLVVWGYDTGAYFAGRWVGRRLLIDHISPSKTVEGLFGGLLLATLAAGVGGVLVGLAPWHALLIGPTVGLAAQAGDLAESMLKRAAGRKESGVIIPGHGGILDRLDSFLFAAPVLVIYAVAFAGQTV
jgi:phosphatidate cytidylyltransferase